jgi:uncharacterized membrane protein YecN with MAPEG domain
VVFPVMSAWVAAVFSLLMVLLSVQISLRRVALKTTHGDAGDATLRKRIRAHGNFIEYAPLALLVLLLVELSGAARGDTWILAVGFVVARALHAAGMLFTRGPALRGIAMLVQHASFIYGAVVLIRRVSGAD